MSVSFFNRNQSLLAVIYLSLFPVLYFLLPELEATKISFYFKNLQVSNWLLKLSCVFILAISAYVLNNFINNSTWLKDGFSHLPGFVFTVTLLVSAKWLSLNIAVLIFCIILSLQIFERTLKRPKALENSFYLGIITGVGFIAFWQFIIVFLAIVLTWNYLRPFVWRENIWLLLGFILPTYLIFSLVFLTVEPKNYTLLFSLNQTESLSFAAKVYLFFSLILGFFALGKFIKNTSKNSLKSRQVAAAFLGIYIGVILFMLPVYFFQEIQGILILLIIPASILITSLFFNPNKKLATNLVFYLWALIALLAILNVY